MYKKISNIKVQIMDSGLVRGNLKRKQLTPELLGEFKKVDAEFLYARSTRLFTNSRNALPKERRWLKTGERIFGKGNALPDQKLPPSLQQFDYKSQIENMRDSTKQLMEFALKILTPENERKSLGIVREGNLAVLLSYCKFWQSSSASAISLKKDLSFNDFINPDIREDFTNMLNKNFPINVNDLDRKFKLHNGAIGLTFGLPGVAEAAKYIIEYPFNYY